MRREEKVENDEYREYRFHYTYSNISDKIRKWKVLI